MCQHDALDVVAPPGSGYSAPSVPPAAVPPTREAFRAVVAADDARGDEDAYLAACRRLAAATGLAFDRLVEGHPMVCEHCGSITTRADRVALDVDGWRVHVCDLCDRRDVGDATRKRIAEMGEYRHT